MLSLLLQARQHCFTATLFVDVQGQPALAVQHSRVSVMLDQRDRMWVPVKDPLAYSTMHCEGRPAQGVHVYLCCLLGSAGCLRMGACASDVSHLALTVLLHPLTLLLSCCSLPCSCCT